MHPKFLSIGSFLLCASASLVDAFSPHHGAGVVRPFRGGLIPVASSTTTDSTVDAWSAALAAQQQVAPSTPPSPVAPQQAATSPTSPAANANINRIATLTSLPAFLDVIDSAPKDSLVVVKFHGKSCPLCKRVALKYKKMARFYSTAPLQFTEIEKTVHPELFNTLEITTFPFLQIYRNGVCVASHGTESAARFEAVIHDTIQQFLRMQSNDWESFLTAFAGPIGKSTQNLQSLRSP